MHSPDNQSDRRVHQSCPDSRHGGYMSKCKGWTESCCHTQTSVSLNILYSLEDFHSKQPEHHNLDMSLLCIPFHKVLSWLVKMFPLVGKGTWKIIDLCYIKPGDMRGILILKKNEKEWKSIILKFKILLLIVQ